MIKVLYFGQIKSISTLSTEQVDDASSLTDLRLQLLEKYPKLATANFVFSVNQKITEACTLKENDEVALLPPFSGG